MYTCSWRGGKGCTKWKRVDENLTKNSDDEMNVNAKPMAVDTHETDRRGRSLSALGTCLCSKSLSLSLIKKFFGPIQQRTK